MATGWYGRSVAAASLTRLPRGICCGVCGLTEPTPGNEDGPADTAQQWATMTRHVLETHCTPCCKCGEAAGGLIELRTGTLAPWVRRSRAPSALHALRARRRTQQRERDRPAGPARTADGSLIVRLDDGRLARAREAAPPLPRARAVGATRGGVSVRRVVTRATAAQPDQPLAIPGRAQAGATQYEIERDERIARNEAYMRSIGIDPTAPPAPGYVAMMSDQRALEAVAAAPAVPATPLTIGARARLRDQMRGAAGTGPTSPADVAISRAYPWQRLEFASGSPPAAAPMGLAIVERAERPPRRARRDAAVYYDLTARPATAAPQRRTQCAHCACERCARETAELALHSADGKVACPAEGCPASLALETLAALLPPEANEAARNRPAFDCVACGERVARRDTIALHRQLPYHHALALAPPPPAASTSDKSACDMCAPCAARWLEIQAQDGAIFARCPTPGCKTPLPREALELLLEPEAYQAHLARARRSYEQRLRDLQARTAAGATDDDGTAAFLRWAGDSTRACPECHVLIYRSEGCAHMSCACGAEFNWDSAERVGGGAEVRAPTPGARRVFRADAVAGVVGEDVMDLMPPFPPPPSPFMAELARRSARRPAQLGREPALDLELERVRSRALQLELDRARAVIARLGDAGVAAAVSPPALADTGVVVALDPTVQPPTYRAYPGGPVVQATDRDYQAGRVVRVRERPTRRSKRAAAAAVNPAPKKRR